MPRAFAVAGLLLIGVAPEAHATIIVDGPPEFQARVAACMEKFGATRDGAADIIDALQTSSRDHVIRPDIDGGLSATSFADPAGANIPPAGTGAGSGTTVDWDPDFPHTFPPGIKRDGCAALIHELSHSLDADRGRIDGSADPATGITRAEISATAAENSYRDSQGLEQRSRYGPNVLPGGAVVP